jgi:regulatory protein
VAFPRSKKLYDAPSLYEYAVAALGRRMRTVAELKRLLRQKNVEGDREAAIEAVILKLKDQKYLNDAQYAAMYSATRRDGAKHGRQRVVTDLKSRGVHGEVIEKAVSSAYEDVNEDELARDYIKRKRLQLPTRLKTRSATDPRVPRDINALKQRQKETARIFRALVRAGFRSATIFRVLKQWEVDDETLTALDEETDSPPRHGDTEES